MSKATKDYSVPAIEKAIAILNGLAHNGKMNIQEMHTDLGIPKTTVFVILSTLERHALIEKQEDGKYALGHGVLYWGMNYYEQSDIKKIARPHIERLAEGTPFTVHLAVLVSLQPVYVDKCEGSGFVRFATMPGQAQPIHMSGVGKALASGLSDEEVAQAVACIPDLPEAKRQQTLANLMEDVLFTREHGYSIEDEQMEEGIRCIGAPVFGPSGEVVASISLTALSKDLPAIKFPTIGEQVKATAMAISAATGYMNRQSV